jgi:hypothetical protein
VDAARRVLTVMCKIFCRHAAVAKFVASELTLGATAYGGGGVRSRGPRGGSWLGGLALRKANLPAGGAPALPRGENGSEQDA